MSWFALTFFFLFQRGIFLSVFTIFSSVVLLRKLFVNLSATTELCNISHICVFVYNNSEANLSGQNCSQLVIYVFYVLHSWSDKKNSSPFLCLTISFSLSRIAYNMSVVDFKKPWFFTICASDMVLCPCKIHAISIDASVKRFEVEVVLQMKSAAHKAKQNAAWFRCTRGYSQVDKYQWIWCAWFSEASQDTTLETVPISFCILHTKGWIDDKEEIIVPSKFSMFILYGSYTLIS